MANIDAPDGFTPIDLQPHHVHRYYKDTTAGIIAIGDPVIRVANSSDPKGYPEIVRATTGAAITGVVVGVEPIYSNLNQSGVLLAADTGYVLVADHPEQEFVVQDNGGATGIAITDIGQHIDSVAAIDANTSTGRSKYEIDTEAKSTNNTWVICRLWDSPNNEVGANARWVVKPNLHTEANASATNVTEI